MTEAGSVHRVEEVGAFGRERRAAYRCVCQLVEGFGEDVAAGVEFVFAGAVGAAAGEEEDVGGFVFIGGEALQDERCGEGAKEDEGNEGVDSHALKTGESG